MRISTLKQVTLWNPKRTAKSMYEEPELQAAYIGDLNCTGQTLHHCLPQPPTITMATIRAACLGKVLRFKQGEAQFFLQFLKVVGPKGKQVEGPRRGVYSILLQQDASGPHQYRWGPLLDLIMFLVQPKQQEKAPLENLIIFRITSLSNLNVPFFPTPPKAQ